MKNLYFLVLLVLFSCKTKNETSQESVPLQLTNVSYAEPSAKTKVSNDDLRFLGEMGLTNSSTYKDNVVRMDSAAVSENSKKYGLRFMTGNTLTAFLEKYELVMGNLSDYKHTIPDEAIIDFKKNYESFKEQDFYFARVSKLSTGRPGAFLCKLKNEDIQEGKEYLIAAGNTLANGQSDQNDISSGLLKKEKYEEIAMKYRVYTGDIIVDHHKPYIQIIAQKEYFDLTGKEIVENKIQHKDPAIVLAVKEGWVVLAYW